MSTAALDTGPVQAAWLNSTRSGSARLNAPLARWPGPETVRVASPAEEMTFAVVPEVYSFVVPGVKAPNVAGAPSDRASVAGTVPPTGASTASPNRPAATAAL